MRKSRFIRNRLRRSKSDELNLELNSLLDVLVILLVFLLKSYSSNEIEIHIPKNIEVPTSISKTEVVRGINIQMSKDFDIWVQDEKILQVKNGVWYDEYQSAIKNKLNSIKDLIERNKMGSENIKGFSGVVNLIMDKSIGYIHIKKLMEISTDVGFEQFKFIVIES